MYHHPMSKTKPLSLLAWKLMRHLTKPIGNPPFDEFTYNRFLLDENGKPWFYKPDGFVTEVVKAAQELIDRGWIWTDSFKNQRLTTEARILFETLPIPGWELPSKPVLTKNDIEVLHALESASRQG